MVAVTKKNISRKKSQRGGSQKLKPVNVIGRWARTKNFFTPTQKTINSSKNIAKSAAAGIPTVGYEAGKLLVKIPGAVVASPVRAYQGIKLWSKGREINKARGFSESNVVNKLEEFKKKKTEWEKLQTNPETYSKGLIKQKTAEKKLILNLTEKINRQSGRKQTNKRSLNKKAGEEILKLLRTQGQGQGEFKTGDDLQKAIDAGYAALKKKKN